MAAMNTAERLAESDYTVPHRAPPPVPSISYASLAPPPAIDAGYASEAASVNSRKPRSRASSFSKLFRREHSNNRSPSQSNTTGYGSNSPPPPVPSFPTSKSPSPQPYPHPEAVTDSATGRKFSFTGSRKTSTEGGPRNMLRKSSKMRKAEEERLEQERLARINQPAPRLPSHNPLPGITDTFAGENNNNNSTYSNFSRPAHAMPSSSSPAYAIRSAQVSSSPDSRGRTNGEYVHESSMSRTESMTNRGRYSYASSTVGGNMSSPRRIRRRKDPTPFNVLVIGAKGSGKTSFISFLRHSFALPNHSPSSAESESTVGGTRSSFTSHYLETEMDGERVGLTLWDSAGLEKNIVDLQLREMTSFVESKFEETFAEEQKVVRSPGVKDTHIHCVFLVLDPVRLDATVSASSTNQKNGASLSNVSGLDDDLDLQVVRVLWGKTTVIPVITKADTLTIAHMSFLKRAVWDSIKAARLDPLEALELEDDVLEEEDEDDDEDATNGANGYEDSEDEPTPHKTRSAQHKRQTSLTASIKSSSLSEDETPYIPMSILSPDPYDLPPYTVPTSRKALKPGRRFAWGLADPYDPSHCDFTRLRDSIFIEWRGELRDLSRSKWYENWRTSRLKNVPGGAGKMRVRGGVTPTAAVPKGSRDFSGSSGGTPRAVSDGSEVQGQRVGKAERVLGVESRGGAVEPGY